MSCAAAMAAGSPTRPGDSESSADLAHWDEGPVRYLLSRTETREFRSLRDGLARAVFIRKFWEVRDSDPGTQVNETRLAFWQRVAQADAQFRDQTGPGWKTDRGRIYVLLGPPVDIQKDMDFRYNGPDGETRGILRWHYNGETPTGRQPEPFVVAFYQDLTSDWRLTTDPKLTSTTFDPLAARNLEGAPGLAGHLADRLSDSQSELAAALDLARLTAPAGDDLSLVDSVASDAVYGTFPMQVRWDFFPGDGAGRTMAVLSVFASKKDLPAAGGAPPPGLFLLGRIEPASGDIRLLSESDFVRAGDGAPDDVWIWQARLLIPAGNASVYAALFDPKSSRAGRMRGPITVPAFDRTLPRISSLLPAYSLSPVTHDSDKGYVVPFVMGSLRVLPRAEPVFHKTDQFAVYFQIDSSHAAPPDAITLRFFRVEGTTERPAGAPQRREHPEPVQGWSFPLTVWPAGQYRLVVTLEAEGAPPAESRLDFEIR